ncbi:M28 family peptidase [Psychroserpens damuponensis]|uniref:M28 family peptidase n=1 Tax=Psychroserpens damuponensis TaxID=943936 RepID=UPI000590B71C|nr:M28 family peptidase [Psychroserpens damuponensis]
MTYQNPIKRKSFKYTIFDVLLKEKLPTMKPLYASIVFILLCTYSSFSQNIQDIINLVDVDKLTLTINEFSGEQSTVVDGNTVTILNREHDTNDLAGDYLIERLEALDNIVVTSQPFNTTGRNIIATQIGKTNPNDIYIVCAHYDTVADFCADDNASGTAAVLEVARLLSTQCLDNTIVYALWDEEEIGLRGSQFYANQANSNGDNILGVLNMDMIGYDGDAVGQPGDNEFDIDYRNIGNSVAMKNDILSVLNTYTFDLNVIEVNPGTTASDHASFWNVGYSAVLVGESWETNDETPFYHSAQDRFATLDVAYLTEMVKLVTGYMVTKGSLVAVDNTVTQNMTILTSNQNSANYQWYNCDTDTAITGATNQSFSPTSNGNYAVEITSGTCVERSSCLLFDTLGLESFATNEVKVYPIPAQNFITVELASETSTQLNLYDVSGKLVLSKTITESSKLNIKDISQGIYFLKVKTDKKSGTFKIVKE